ncbi:glycosyltransferase family 87 protein [Halorarius litoreus]|uniref:glycosyltransferase family 87 protein n=1 Tax=Halorarius litoreus TaxID=2962676 RepID=UPI0020CD84CB|nr:glycosyltransferase family 87 protein [Halorarius litoreus]
MPSARRGSRVVLAVGTLLGLATLAWLWATQPEALGVNFRVYRVAADAMLASGDPYAVHPVGEPAYRYVYPPGTLPLFVPYTLLPASVGFALHTLTAVVAGGVLTRVVGRTVARRGHALTRLDHALVFGFVTVSPVAVPSLFYGNVNLQLAALVAVGVDRVDDGARSGGVLAVPAVLKAFPAVFLAVPVRYAATWRDRLRAVGAASGVAVLVFGGGLLAFGPAATRAWLAALAAREGRGAGRIPPGADLVTLRRPLSQLLADAPLVVATLAVLLLVPPALYLLVTADVDQRHLAALGVGLATLLALPSYPLYYVLVFGMAVPLLYLVEGPARPAVLVGTLLLTLHVTGAELTWLFAAVGTTPPAVVETLFAFATPPLVGALLLLGACVVGVTGEQVLPYSAPHRPGERRE